MVKAGAGTRTTRRRAFAALGLLLAVTGAPAARAQSAPSSTASAPTPPEAQQKAEQHYKRAREFYASGAYREAATELEAAHGLDPNAKELVFNLGVVSEKLGRIDDALRYFRLYAQMDGVTAAEKQKADALIRRLEGAKREIVPPTPTPTPPAAEKDQQPKPPERGRIDAATIVAGSVAVVGFGVGAGFGIKALADKPKSNYVTGRDGTYQDLQNQRTRATTESVVADVGLGVGVVAAAIAAYLYFSRTKVSTTPTGTGMQRGHADVSASPVPGGGAFVVQGTF